MIKMSDKKLDLILNGLQEMKQEQREMKQDQQGMKQEQQDIKSQMNNRFDTLETTLSLINEKVNVMDQKIDGVHEQVAKNVADITQLKAVQERMVTIQEHQEKTIDLLARRSIDHEAELRKIK